jgi:hypothetical protein
VSSAQRTDERFYSSQTRRFQRGRTCPQRVFRSGLSFSVSNSDSERAVLGLIPTLILRAKMLKQVSRETVEKVLASAGNVALIGLAAIYTRAAIQRDLLANPNWTISSVMVYPYNLPITYFVIFPAFITICAFYALKLDSARVRTGAAVAVVGGLGLIAHPVTTHETEHVLFALLIFTSSGFWYPECTDKQFRNFVASTIFFFGGFLLDLFLNGGGGVVGIAAGQGGRVNLPLLRFVPSICCAVGELGIFVSWGQMTQLSDNNLSSLRSNTNSVTIPCKTKTKTK